MQCSVPPVLLHQWIRGKSKNKNAYSIQSRHCSDVITWVCNTSGKVYCKLNFIDNFHLKPQVSISKFQVYEACKHGLKCRKARDLYKCFQLRMPGPGWSRRFIFCAQCFQPLPDGTFLQKTMLAFLFQRDLSKFFCSI